MSLRNNPRRRAAPLSEGAGDDNANRRRGGSGRFQRSTPCDFCGKSCAAEHFTDERACGGGDGPGFYLCGRVTCERARARLESAQGFEALKRHYAAQRSKNNAIQREKPKAFLDGPPGTERELEKLRREQTRVQGMLARTTEPEKVASLQAKERELQERVDRLAFPEHMMKTNARRRLSLDPMEQRALEIAETMSRDKQGYAYVPSDAASSLQQKGLVSIVGVSSYGEKKITITDAGRKRLGLYETNASTHYVWVLNHDGTPKDEGPYGPKDRESAKTYARIAAAKGAHDRAVSRGLDPQGQGFEIVRVYQRGTGERLQ